MLGEWYLPPGECQVISTITEGTISISHSPFLSAQTRISQTSSLQADTSHVSSTHPCSQIRRSEPCRDPSADRHSFPQDLAVGLIGRAASFEVRPLRPGLCSRQRQSRDG